MVRALFPGIHHQFFHRHLLAHHPFLEVRNVADRQRLRSVVAHQARNFHHRIGVKVMNRAVVRHNQQHPFLGIKGNRRRQIDDVGSVFVNFQIASGGFARRNNRPAGAKDVFLTMIHHLIGAGAFRIGVRHDVVREQVVLEVSIRHRIRVQRLYVFRLGESVVPAGFGVRVV